MVNISFPRVLRDGINNAGVVFMRTHRHPVQLSSRRPCSLNGPFSSIYGMTAGVIEKEADTHREWGGDTES